MTQYVGCYFEIREWSNGVDLYTSVVEDTKIFQHSELEFVGDHVENYTNLDVEQVNFLNCTISRVPQGLTKFFPNLKVITIRGSKLREIKRDDLKEYSDLTNLHFPNNNIEYLSGDLFMDMKSLHFLSFENNKIKVIQPSIFDGLKNLRSMKLKGNPCISKFCTRRVCTCWDLPLNDLKADIREKFSGMSWKLAFQKFKNLNKENRDKHILLNKNYHLKKENEELKLKCDDGVSNDVMKIIQNEKLKDFTVKVGDEEFKVHKFLLAARSPVFAEMIENNIDAEELNLTDISTEIFREIINFIYTDDYPTSNEINSIHLFAAAGRLKIDKLRDFAALKVFYKINSENALEILKLANKYENVELKQKSFEEVKKLIKNVTVTEDLVHRPDKLYQLLETQKKNEIQQKTKKIIKFKNPCNVN